MIYKPPERPEPNHKNGDRGGGGAQDAYGAERRTRVDDPPPTNSGRRARAHGSDETSDGLLGGSESERAREAALVFAKHNKTLEMLNKESLVIMTQRGNIAITKISTEPRDAGKTMGKMRGGDEVTKATTARLRHGSVLHRPRAQRPRATIPEAPPPRGNALTRVLKLAEGESITAMLPVSSADEAEAGVRTSRTW